MKKVNMFLTMLLLAGSITVFSQGSGKLVSNKTFIKFYSHTSVEDIQATNTSAVSTINPETGDVVFSVPMQGFQFEKELMQKHFNSANFLDTKKFPKAKFTGKITNLDEVNFTTDGTYAANVTGDMTIKGVTKKLTEKGTVTVKGNTVSVETKFNLTLADFGITFKKGKPSTNIAKTIEVTAKAEYASK